MDITGTIPETWSTMVPIFKKALITWNAFETKLRRLYIVPHKKLKEFFLGSFTKRASCEKCHFELPFPSILFSYACDQVVKKHLNDHQN